MRRANERGGRISSGASDRLSERTMSDTPCYRM